MILRARVALIALLTLAGCRGAGKGKDLTDAARRPSGDEGSLTPIELLGKRLFEDPTLSTPPGLSCASCHDPDSAFQGNNGSSIPAVARGSRPSSKGVRNTPTLLYAMLAPSFSFMPMEHENATSKQVYVPVGGLLWDGRASTLAEQAKIPILDPREMNVPTPAVFVERVRMAPYAALARDVLGASLDDPAGAFDALAVAISAFEHTPRFQPFRSKFDDFLRGKDSLNAAEARGFALFQDPSKGNCISCHVGKQGSLRSEDWPFTDFSYSALGVPRNAAIPDNADPAYFDLGLCNQPQLARYLPPQVSAQGYCGFFRVPSLRNVAVTAPYMHNGALATLRDVVTFYVTRDTNMSAWYPKDGHDFVHRFDDLPFAFHGNVSMDEVPYDRDPGQTPRLDPNEVEDVVAFLETLTDR